MAGNQKYGLGISVGILDLNNSELTKEIKSDTNQSYGGTPSFISLTPDERYAIVGCPSRPTSTNYVVFDVTIQQELIQPPTITLDSDPKCSIVLNNEHLSQQTYFLISYNKLMRRYFQQTSVTSISLKKYRNENVLTIDGSSLSFPKCCFISAFIGIN